MAGVVNMVPEGLVLLTSIAFAVGVVRLGRRNCLVKELPAVEGLARVTVVCLDKTGTLTDGQISLRSDRAAAGFAADEVHAALAALVAADPSPNPTLAAIGAAGAGAASAAGAGAPPVWSALDRMPFSSARKWSGASFDNGTTWLLGAPEMLVPAGHAVLGVAAAQAATGQRVVVLCRAPSLTDLTAVEPAALVGLEERLRPDAAETVAYFLAQDVALRVISGDNPETVAAVAARAGVPGADRHFDARELPEDPDELAALLASHTVFGRVRPDQKRAMIAALQRAGHTVAMTGDGVNDVLALKDADLGIAMGSGSDAARAVAQVILLDGKFSSLPDVVAEGRRVLANIERVATLFITKTVYALLLAVAVGVAGIPYPFFPRHLSMVAALTIGIPGFFLALAPARQRVRPGFAGRVLRFVAITGPVAAVAVLAANMVTGTGGETVDAHQLEVAHTTAFAVLLGVGFLVLAEVARPFNTLRRVLWCGLVALAVAVLALPPAQSLLALVWPGRGAVAAAATIVTVAGAVLVGARRFGRLVPPGGSDR